MVPEQIFVVAEAGLLTALIVYQSVKGFSTVLGALLGLGVATLLEDQFHILPEMHFEWVLCLWYSAWGVVGILLFTFFQKRTLAFFSPCAGGFLLSSSIGYFLKLWYFSLKSSSRPTWLDVRGSCWLDFAGALLGFDAPAGIIGVFEAKSIFVQPVDIDRVLGRLLWFLFF